MQRAFFLQQCFHHAPARKWLWIFMLLAWRVAALLLSTSALAMERSPSPGGIQVRVERGAWGAARVQDIERVLTSVADVLAPSFPRHASAHIVVEYSKDGPAVLFEKSAGGAYRILLNVQDTRWDQFAYQFSHELCHVFTNFEHREIDNNAVIRNNQWFEETLCEAVSILTLKRVAATWERSPPYPAWKDYAPAFGEYAQRLLDEPHRRLSSNLSTAEWYGTNQAPLDRYPYLRQKNEFLAARLLPGLENTPGGLEAIGYLNLEEPRPSRDIGTYLKSWHTHCPEKYRAFISQVIALLGKDNVGHATPATL
jgi:hypothetical protein